MQEEEARSHFQDYIALQRRAQESSAEERLRVINKARAIYDLLSVKGFKIKVDARIHPGTPVLNFKLLYQDRLLDTERLEFTEEETERFGLACAVKFFDEFIQLANQDYHSPAVDERLKEIEVELIGLGFSILVAEDDPPEGDDNSETVGEVDDGRVQLILVKRGCPERKPLREGCYHMREPNFSLSNQAVAPAGLEATLPAAIRLFYRYCNVFRIGLEEGIAYAADVSSFNEVQDWILSDIKRLGWAIALHCKRGLVQEDGRTMVSFLLILLPAERKNEQPMAVEEITSALSAEDAAFLFPDGSPPDCERDLASPEQTREILKSFGIIPEEN